MNSRWAVIWAARGKLTDGDPNLLGANRNGDGSWLNAYWDRPDDRWNREGGFAFLLPQIASFLSLIFGREFYF